MQTSQELKELFTALLLDAQSRLLDELLVEHELKGSVLLAAQPILLKYKVYWALGLKKRFV